MSEEKKEEAEPAKKSKKKLFLIIGLAAVVLLGGGAAAVIVLKGKKGAAPAATEAGAGGEHGAPAEGAPAGGAGGEGHAAPSESVLTLDTFVINLADPRGDRFLKLSLRAVTKDEGLQKKLDASELMKSRIRDRIISILSAKTYQEIANPIGKESMRRELAQELNGVLGPGTISEILFTDFIVQ